jgi:hypothetical protein
MATYVQGYGSDNWHWCTNCTQYPKSIAKSTQSRPSGGDLCNQCKSKEREGTCRT